MKVLKIFAVYTQLCVDAKNLEQLEVWVHTDRERQLLQSLFRSNMNYRQELVALVQDNFPVTATDVTDWSEKEWGSWLDLLIAYPVFWQGKQETLIGLFWSLDNKGILIDTDKIALLCTHSEMVDYAADFRNNSVVVTLNALIEKYATLLQAEMFQNRVDMKINDIY